MGISRLAREGAVRSGGLVGKSRKPQRSCWAGLRPAPTEMVNDGMIEFSKRRIPRLFFR